MITVNHRLKAGQIISTIFILLVLPATERKVLGEAETQERIPQDGFGKMFERKFIALILMVLVLPISGCIDNIVSTGNIIKNETEEFFSEKEKPAKLVCNKVETNNLRKINIEKVQDYEDYKEMASGINSGLLVVSEELGGDFKKLPIKKSARFLDEIDKKAIKFTPLIDNYNQFIDACDALNTGKKASVNRVYKEGFLFAGEATLLATGVPEKSAGKIVGYLGLDAVKYCPSCVTVAKEMLKEVTEDMIRKSSTKLIENGIEGLMEN